MADSKKGKSSEVKTGFQKAKKKGGIRVNIARINNHKCLG